MDTSDQMSAPTQVILFDGVCNLCNGAVQFIIRRDRNAGFSFAALQSDYGKQFLLDHQLNPSNLYSIILVRGDQYFEKSRAALEIAKGLDGLWPLLYSFIIVPPFIRDAVYDWIARNRYRWFGVQESCMIPTPELKSRFLG